MIDIFERQFDKLFGNIKPRKKIIVPKLKVQPKELIKIIFNKAVIVTLLSVLSFVIPALIDGFILEKYFDLTGSTRHFVIIGFSLVIIIINLLIAKKWLSLKEIGIRKSCLIRSFVFSLVFVASLRIFDYFGYKEALNNNLAWDKTFLIYLSSLVFLAFQEELMFRGVIFKVWEKYKGFLVALFISSILFGLEHLLYPAMGFEKVTLSRALTTALFGPVFILVAYRTKNIWGLSLSHFIYNFSLLVASPVIGDIEPKDTFLIATLGVSIFLPIMIDFIYRKRFETKSLQIMWGKYLATLFLAFFVLIAALSISEDFGWFKDNRQYCPYLDNEKTRDCINENIERDENCYGIDLELDEANEKLEGNKKALEVLKDNCLWLFDTKIHDFTGDGENEIAMIVAGAGCGSCHYQRIYIIKGDEVIFQKETEDVNFWPAENYPGFIIRFPLRKQGEAYCCPSESIVESYTVSNIDSNYKSFYKFDEHYEPYIKD